MAGAGAGRRLGPLSIAGRQRPFGPQVVESHDIVGPWRASDIVLRLMRGEPAEGLSPSARRGGIDLDIEEVRIAVRTYFERYNEHWLPEKTSTKAPPRSVSTERPHHDHARGRITVYRVQNWVR
jgi:hypothetical protein